MGITELGPRIDVEKIVVVAVSGNVVDGSMTVERVVWVVTGKTQLMVPDWLKSIPLASPELPDIMAFVQVGDIWSAYCLYQVNLPAGPFAEETHYRIKASPLGTCSGTINSAP